jgi:hypothetical protein
MAQDESKLKAAVLAVKERERPGIDQTQLSKQFEIAALRRDLTKQLQPILANAGFDVNRINELLVKGHNELARLIEKQKADAARQLAASIPSYREGMKNRARALTRIAGNPLTITTIPLETPYSIWVTPLNMLVDSHAEPHNNWATCRLTDNKDTAGKSASVKFYFAWNNDSGYLAVINCNADVIVRGWAEALADPRVFGGSSWLPLYVKLKVYLGGGVIDYEGSQTIQIASLPASAGWGLFGNPGDIKFQSFNNSYTVSCTNIEVQDQEIVVFEVSLEAINYWIDGGSISFDFADSGSGNEVLCPTLNVEMLTPPTMTTAA